MPYGPCTALHKKNLPIFSLIWLGQVYTLRLNWFSKYARHLIPNFHLRVSSGALRLTFKRVRRIFVPAARCPKGIPKTLVSECQDDGAAEQNHLIISQPTLSWPRECLHMREFSLWGVKRWKQCRWHGWLDLPLSWRFRGAAVGAPGFYLRHTVGNGLYTRTLLPRMYGCSSLLAASLER